MDNGCANTMYDINWKMEILENLIWNKVCRHKVADDELSMS